MDFISGLPKTARQYDAIWVALRLFIFYLAICRSCGIGFAFLDLLNLLCLHELDLNKYLWATLPKKWIKKIEKSKHENRSGCFLSIEHEEEDKKAYDEPMHRGRERTSAKIPKKKL